MPWRALTLYVDAATVAASASFVLDPTDQSTGRLVGVGLKQKKKKDFYDDLRMPPMWRHRHLFIFILQPTGGLVGVGLKQKKKKTTSTTTYKCRYCGGIDIFCFRPSPTHLKPGCPLVSTPPLARRSHPRFSCLKGKLVSGYLGPFLLAGNNEEEETSKLITKASFAINSIIASFLLLMESASTPLFVHPLALISGSGMFLGSARVLPLIQFRIIGTV
ncbi:hypothetical protein AVEN_105255-1 [Araneus ventricosus]|uniref:Uncharacterized protein n=1 Tax=Araneus ventricosus TaxID=182803 RepID=A0A4Y1ZR95_ARAVE|nr:hypothetical protein AVEN_105255-1 [Araneus ventricosus]